MSILYKNLNKEKTMKKMVVKRNKKAISVKVDDRFYAILDPSLKYSMRIVLKEQLELFNQIDDKKSVEELVALSKKDKKLVMQFLIALREVDLIDFDKSPKAKETKKIKHLNLWIHMTDKCNLRCKYCYVSTLDTYKTMSKEVLDRIEYKLIEAIENDKELSMIHLKLSGGEIFSKFDYWKDIVKRWKHLIEERKVVASIVCLSNMTILNEKIISYLKQNDIPVGVSLDGVGEFHNRNRVFINQKGTFKKIIENLEKLEKNGVKFSISTTVTNESIEGLGALTRFLIKKGYPFRYTNVKGEPLDIDKLNRYYDISFEIMKNGIEDGFRFSNLYNQCDLTIHNPDKDICGMGKFGGAIYLDGKVYFCHTHFGKGEPLGDIFEDEPLQKIIKRGKKYWGELSEDCKKCPYEVVCAGACPVYRVNGKSPICEFYKSNIPKIYSLIAKENLTKALRKKRKINKKITIRESN
jgi:uncharacterized protein